MFIYGVNLTDFGCQREGGGGGGGGEHWLCNYTVLNDNCKRVAELIIADYLNSLFLIF